MLQRPATVVVLSFCLFVFFQALCVLLQSWQLFYAGFLQQLPHKPRSATNRCTKHILSLLLQQTDTQWWQVSRNSSCSVTWKAPASWYKVHCFLSDQSAPLRLSTSSSVRRQRPAFSMQVIPDNSNIQDIVFQRIRSRLEQLHSNLSDRIDAIIQRAGDVKTLSEADVWKVRDYCLIKK